MIGATEAFLGSTSHFGEYPKKKEDFLKEWEKEFKKKVKHAMSVGDFSMFGGANGTSVDPKNIMQIMMMSEMLKGSGSGDNKMMAFMAMSMMGNNNPFAGLMSAMNPIAPITTTPAVMTTPVQTAVPAEAATTDSKNTTV